MGLIDLPFQIARLIAAAALAASSQNASGAKEAKGAQQPDVVISETFGKKFALDKPAVDLGFTLEHFAPPSDTAGLKSTPGGGEQQAVSMLLEALGYPQSRHVAKPWLPEIPGPDAAEFQLALPPQKDVKTWELKIYDAAGRTASVMQGKGIPSSQVSWDLKTVTGGHIQPGMPYNYRLQLFGRKGKQRSFLGKSFELPALQFYEDKSRVIEIATKVLFDPKGANFLPDGEDYLLKALEIVTEERAAIRKFYLQDNVPATVLQKRAQALNQVIAREFRSLPGEVAIERSAPKGRGSIFRVVIER